MAPGWKQRGDGRHDRRRLRRSTTSENSPPALDATSTAGRSSPARCVQRGPGRPPGHRLPVDALLLDGRPGEPSQALRTRRHSTSTSMCRRTRAPPAGSSSFGKESDPVRVASRPPYVAGLTPNGRLLASAGGSSPSSRPRSSPGSRQQARAPTRCSGHGHVPVAGAGLETTYSTSAVLDLAPGQWFYRVRGLNQMQLRKPQMCGRLRSSSAWQSRNSGCRFAKRRPRTRSTRSRRRLGSGLDEPRPRSRSRTCRRGRRFSLGRFRAHDLIVETKPDRTPVTEADRAVEEAIRDGSRWSVPATACSARSSAVSGGGRRRWILDPIDGTRNYSRGIPVWATLIALEEDGVSGSASSRRPRSGAAGGPNAAWVPSPTEAGSASPPSPRSPTQFCASRSSRSCRHSLTAAGTPEPTATSGRTCSWPRAPQTAPSTQSG